MTNAHLEIRSSEGSRQGCPKQQDIIREAKDKESVC